MFCLRESEISDILRILFFFIHLFLQSHQAEIGELLEILKGKVHLLPEILRRSRSEKTCRKYEMGFIRWKKWAECNGVESKHTLPAQVFPIALYLVSLIPTAIGTLGSFFIQRL